MHILQITPASSDSRSGNRTTAERWAAILESLDHQVTTMSEYAEGGNYDACLALHAYKSGLHFVGPAPRRPLFWR